MNKSEYTKRYRQKHPERAKAYMKKYREEHPEKFRAWKKKDREIHKDVISERTQKWRQANPDKMNGQRLRQRYSLSKADYEKLVKAQNGICAICGKEPNGHRLFIDHDHKTGNMRGLLCRNCNFALELFEDDSKRLLSAINYLRRREKEGIKCEF